jgi:nucleoside-diphosphate-sugar epimerase
MKVFVAGATGAVGRPLVRALVAGGHDVVASTRSRSKLELLRGLGAEPVVLDGLDAEAVGVAIARSDPEVIVHQMTALTGTIDMKHFDRSFATTNQLRTAGLDHLIAAGRASGARRIVAQSYTGWPNAPVGGPVKSEEDPLDPNPPRQQRETLSAIQYLERTVTDAPLEGVALRYGMLYGPGASDELPAMMRARKMPIVGDGGGVWSMTHVDDAAAAVVTALTRGQGIYNIVDDEPAPVRDIFTVLAREVGAKPPRHVPVWLARMVAGDVGVSMLTQARGSSNAKARRELGWTPLWPSWRAGFRQLRTVNAMVE